MNHKECTVSSYSDLSKLSSKTIHIHLRKFVSVKLIEKILSISPYLKKISISHYVEKRLNEKILANLSLEGIEIVHSKPNSGRPNLIELYNRKVSKQEMLE
ncbi:MAG: hypothetical protein HYW22_01750 [Candidatus Aenigmarchaeota archaeon]|nr:hypothetical protein [Candidatus Aenigmarchaeota archaeon]